MIEQILNIIVKYKVLISLGLYLILLFPVVYEFLSGLEKGFKKSLWKFIIRCTYLIVFIVTLNTIANALFNASLFGLPGMLKGILASESSIEPSTLKDLSAIVAEKYLSDVGGMNANIEYVRAMVDGLFIYSLKVVWGILYFIIIVPIIRLLLRILIYNPFLKDRKADKKVTKDPLLGSLVGLFNGLTKTFVMMVAFTGIFAVISYSGQITQTVENTKQLQSQSAKVESEEGLKDLAEGEEGGSGMESILGEYVSPAVKIIKEVNNIWSENKLVEMASSYYFTDEEVSGTEKITVKRNLLEKVFDDLVYIEYKVEGEDKDYYQKINPIEDINKIFNAALYMLDDENVIQSNGKVDLSKLDSSRVEESFTYLSNVKMFKVGIVIGLNFAFENYADQVTGIDMSDKDFQNELYALDFTSDLSGLGKMVGGMVELGLADFLQEVVIEGKSPDLTDIDNLLYIFSGDKKEGESDSDYNARVQASRNKVSKAAESLKIIEKGSKIISTYLVNTMLKDQIEKWGLNDEDINRLAGSDVVSYKEKLISEIDLSKDLGTVFEIVFDVADYKDKNGGKIGAIMDYFQGKEGSDIDKDAVADLLNNMLSKAADLSFIEATLDCSVKIMTVSLKDNETVGKYLLETNIFSSYISWKDEIGEKIPNLVTALIQSEFTDILIDMKNSGSTDVMASISDLIFSSTSSDDKVLGSLLNDTVSALFEMQILSNLEDTCLKPLLTDLVSSLGTGSFTIKISDDLGEKQSFKDEILLTISLLDDVLDGAKEKGATSFDSLTSDTSCLIGGVSNLDPEKLEKSSIIAPTIVNLLATFENDMLKVPYIYEDDAWYSKYNAEGVITKKGELYLLIDAIKSSTSVILDIMDSTKDGGLSTTQDYLDLIKDITDDKLSKLLESKTISYTISGLLEGIDTGSASIIIPSTAKDDILVTKYKEEDGLTKTEEYVTIKDSEGNDVKVYKSVSSVLKGDELMAVIHAIGQIGNIDDLLKDDSIIQSITGLKGECTSDADWAYTDETKAEKKSKIDVIFDSSILTCTISKYMTGDNYESDTFVFPVSSMEEIDDFYYIKKAEAVKMFNSIITLIEATDLTDLNSFDTSMVEKIVDLTDSQMDEIFSSDILNAIVSNVVLKVDSISIPYIEDNGYYPVEKIQILSETSTKDFYNITKKEYKALFSSLKTVFPTTIDLNNIDTTEIVNNLLEIAYKSNNGDDTDLNKFMESYIFRATLSKFITDVDSLIVPMNSVETYSKIAYDNTNKAYEEKSSYTLKLSEEKSLIKSLEKVFPYSDGGIAGDISTIDFSAKVSDILTLDKADYEVMLDSSILLSTISDKLTSTEVVSIPKDCVTTAKELTKDSEGAYIESTYDIKNINKDDIVALLCDLSFVFSDGFDLNDTSSFNVTDTVNKLLKLAFQANASATGEDEKLNEIMESKIFVATLSSKITDTSSIVVPEEAGTFTKTVTQPTTHEFKELDAYILTDAEVKDVLKGLERLFPYKKGGVSADLASTDFSKKISDILSLKKSDYDIILKSKIMNAIISDKMISTDIVVVPKNCTDLTHQIVKDSEGNMKVSTSDLYTIKKEDLSALLNDLSYVFSDGLDISDSSTFKLTDAVNALLEPAHHANISAYGESDKLNELVSSKIFVATLSKKIFGVNTVVVPQSSVESIQAISYDGTTYNLKDTYELSSSEVKTMLKSMELLFPYRKGGLSCEFADIDYTEIIGNLVSLDHASLENIMSSGTLQMTLSNSLLGITNIFAPTDLCTMRYVVSQNASGIYVSDAVQKYAVDKDELVSLLESLSYIFPDKVDMSTISVNTVSEILKLSDSELDAMFSSALFDAIISSKIENTGNILIPVKAKLNTTDSEMTTVSEVKEVVEILAEAYDYSNVQVITKNELVNLIKALRHMFDDNLDLSGIGIDNFKTLSSLSTAEFNEFTNSPILNATISDKLPSAFSGSQEIVIPETVLVPYRTKTMTSSDADIYMIDKTEIKNLIKAMGYFDFESMGSGSSSFTAFKQLADEDSNGDRKIEKILDSKILSATISDIILKMDMGSMKVMIPSTALESATVYSLDKTTKLISTNAVKELKNTETINLVVALKYIDTTGLSGGSDGAFNTLKSLLAYSEFTSGTRKIDYVLESTILRSTLSNYIVSMETSSLDLVIPFNGNTLDATGATPTLYENVASSKSTQPTFYAIKGQELKNFVIGISSLDLSKLSSAKIEAIQNLNNPSEYDSTKKNIEQINNSYILNATISNYLMTNASSLGFSGGIVFPESVAGTSQNTVKYQSSTFQNADKYYIQASELNSFISGLSKIDLNNIAVDPMNAISKLGSSISTILESKILKYTLSNQIINTATNADKSWKFYIPEQSFYNSREEFNIYNSTAKNFTGKCVILNDTDVIALVGQIGKIDINNLSASEFLKMSEAEISQLMTSNILSANIAVKFKDALMSNSNVNAYYTTEMESSDLTVKAQNIATLPELNTITKQEIIDIMGSIKVLGGNDLSSFNVSLSTITNFTDDGDNSNDDDRTYDSGDSRAKFLRSIFIRSLVSKKVLTETSIKDASYISTKIDEKYDSTRTISIADKVLTYNTATGKLSWNEATINGDLTGLTQKKAYRIMIDGQVLSEESFMGVLEYTTEKLEYDIHKYVSSIGRHEVSVVAVDVEYATYPYQVNILKPVQYNMYIETVSDTLATVSPSIVGDDITFNKVTNADSYTITVCDYSTDAVVFTTELSSKDTTIKQSLKDLLSPGKYYYKITAKSNESYFYSSSYSSKATETYTVNGTLDKAEISIIEDVLYIEKVEDASSYEIQINGTPVALSSFNSEVIAANSKNVYKANVADLVATYGSYTISVTAKAGEFYIQSDNSLTFKYIDNSITGTLTDDKLVMNKVENADRYKITVKREISSGVYEYSLYKEVEVTSTGAELDMSSLKKGYKYVVSVTPISESTTYVSEASEFSVNNQKALNKAYSHRVDDSLNLTFNKDEKADTFIIKLYKYDGTSFVLEDTKNANSANINLLTLFSAYTFLEDTKYKVTVTSTITNTSSQYYGLYTDSVESVGREFSLAKMDRVYDIELIDDLNSNPVVFSDIEDAVSYTMMLYKVEVVAGVETTTLVTTKSFNKSAYLDSSKVTIDLDTLFSGVLDDTDEIVTYRVYTYTDSIDSAHAQSNASKVIEFYK